VSLGSFAFAPKSVAHEEALGILLAESRSPGAAGDVGVENYHLRMRRREIQQSISECVAHGYLSRCHNFNSRSASVSNSSARALA
jgi:hypothetical protein